MLEQISPMISLWYAMAFTFHVQWIDWSSAAWCLTAAPINLKICPLSIKIRLNRIPQMLELLKNLVRVSILHMK